jgi:uncharacterized protein
MKELSIWLFASNMCNCRCAYCYIPPLEKQILMSKENCQKFLDISNKIIDNKILDRIYIRLSGGEPLLAFNNFKDIINNLDKDRFRIEMNTNLTILNDEIIDYFKRNDMSIGVSLDSLKFQKPFVGGISSAEVVMKNLQKCYENDVRVGICSVLDYKNNDDFEDLTKYICDNKKYIAEWMFGTDFLDYELIKYKDKIIKILKKIIDDFDNLGGQFHVMKIMNMKFSNYPNCPAGRTLLSVSADLQECSPCHAVINDLPLGKYDIDIIDRLQTHKNNEYFRNATVPEKCNICKLYKFCAGGCRLQHKSIENMDALCDIRKAVFKHMKRFL